MLSSLNWNIFFEAVLGPTAAKYQLDVTEQEIIIHTDNADVDGIYRKLTTMLRSPEAFRNGLQYVVVSNQPCSKTSSEMAVIHDMKEVTPPVDDVKQGKQILKNIFGDDALEAWAMSIDLLFGRGAYMKDGKLYSIAGSNDSYTLWKRAFEELMTRFSGADEVMMRSAWIGKQALPSDLGDPASETTDADDEVSEPAYAEGLLVGCYRGLNDRICVDLLRLYQLIFPAYLLVEQNEFGAMIRMNREHLFSCAQYCSRGEILHLYKDRADAEKGKAQWIVLDRAAAFKRRDYFTFLLDFSSSMQDSGVKILSDKCLEIIDSIGKHSPNALVRIVWFSTEAKRSEEFDLSKKESMAQLRIELSKSIANGSTRLSHTIYDELVAIHKQSALNYNHIVVTFTDGEDNHDMVSEQDLKAQIDRFDKSIVPYLLTVGHGSPDIAMLGNLSRATNSAYYHLSDLTDFSCAVAPAMQKAPRKLTQLLLALAEETIQTTISVQESREPQLPDLVVPFGAGESMTVTKNGMQAYTVTFPPMAQIKVATSSDLLRELSHRVRDLVQSDCAGQQNALVEELQRIRSQLRQFKNLSREEETEQRNLDSQFSEYEAALTRAVRTGNVGYRMNAITLAGSRSGVFAPSIGPRAVPALTGSTSAPSLLYQT